MQESATKPLFSIITVTYNASDTVRRTLESVAAQTCALYEHLIIDGASTDGTTEIAREYESTGKVKIHSAPDKGIYHAMNKGISLAEGDYLIFLNAGDTFHSPDTLNTYADAIFANDYPGIVYGQTDIVDNDGKYLGPRHLKAPEHLTLKSFADGMLVCHQAMAVYRSIPCKYDLRYRFSADYEWVIKCLQHSRKNVYVGCTTVDYLSEGMTTAHHLESLRERFSIMCRYYGTVPTLLRHLRFATRWLARRGPNKQ